MLFPSTQALHRFALGLALSLLPFLAVAPALTGITLIHRHDGTLHAHRLSHDPHDQAPRQAHHHHDHDEIPQDQPCADCEPQEHGLIVVVPEFRYAQVSGLSALIPGADFQWAPGESLSLGELRPEEPKSLGAGSPRDGPRHQHRSGARAVLARRHALIL
jgi:hypothetical protein